MTTPRRAPASPHPVPHSMNGAPWPEQPPSCDCECSRCWGGHHGDRAGCCLCPDCLDEHHDHSRRKAVSPQAGESRG